MNTSDVRLEAFLTLQGAIDYLKERWMADEHEQETGEYEAYAELNHAQRKIQEEAWAEEDRDDNS
jgi:hypothetical protein